MTKLGQKTRENLGHKIQKLRKALDITQEEFAHRVGISRTHAGHIEQGRKSPSIKVMEKMAKILKVKVKELFP